MATPVVLSTECSGLFSRKLRALQWHRLLQRKLFPPHREYDGADAAYADGATDCVYWNFFVFDR